MAELVLAMHQYRQLLAVAALEFRVCIDINDSNLETIEALNDKSYTLDDGMCVVCDDNGVAAVGGIIGGVPTSVTESTTNVLLACD
jgi:phenylalanyl-tRNA synthetase beta subunit